MAEWSKWLPQRHLGINRAVWPDRAIYWTLGNFSKPVATISWPKSPTFLGNSCKGVKIFNFSVEFIFGQLLQTFGDFLLVTLQQIPSSLLNRCKECSFERTKRSKNEVIQCTCWRDSNCWPQNWYFDNWMTQWTIEPTRQSNEKRSGKPIAC